jgi:hypothetical protein
MVEYRLEIKSVEVSSKGSGYIKLERLNRRLKVKTIEDIKRNLDRLPDLIFNRYKNE